MPVAYLDLPSGVTVAAENHELKITLRMIHGYRRQMRHDQPVLQDPFWEDSGVRSPV